MTVRELHEKAMAVLDSAMACRALGQRYTELMVEAYRLEKEAVEAFLSSAYGDAEPTRSVLLRSAANLAIDCGELREAEQLAARGLAGDPPEAIAGELRDTLDRINFARHLDLDGLELSRHQLQASLHGNSVAQGIAPMEEVEDRMHALRIMTERTAERRAGREYRKGNAAPQLIRESVRPFVSIARAASYAFTVQFGVEKRQLSLDFEGSPVEQVIDDLLAGLRMVDAGDDDGLIGLIPDESYRRNFTALAQQIAPDGDRIKQVGFTVIRGDKEVRVAMVRATQEPAKVKDEGEGPGERRKVKADPHFRLEGVLLDGLGSSQHIVIRTDDGVDVKVRVQEGLEDTVRSYFNRSVVAEGTIKARARTLTKMSALR